METAPSYTKQACTSMYKKHIKIESKNWDYSLYNFKVGSNVKP